MQHSRLVRIFGLLMLLSVLLWTLGAAKEDPQNPSRKKAGLAKTTGDPIHQVLNINNFLTWFKSNGDGNNPPSEGGDGGYYPKGTRWVIFEDGMMWRAKAYLDAALTQQAPGQLIRVGGSSYNTSTAAGYVVGTGATAAPLDPAANDARMYRIRRDYKSMSQQEMQADAADYNEVLFADATQAMIDDIMARYDFDWNNWPVDKGAPYIERNGIPGYQKPPAFSKTFTVDSLIAGHYDEPGVAGSDPNSPADQVMWTAFNDLNEATSQGGWGSDPLGLELQATIWGYKRSDALGQLYFKRYRIINKGGVFTDLAKTTKGAFFIDSMFVCQWADPDLGGAGDDLVGCDTLKSIGFVYNGNAIDNEFKKFNLPPPSAAYDFLAGPIVASPGDSAVFDFKFRQGYKNLPMTSFCYFSAGSPISDPPFSYEGALRWYRMLNGFVPDASTAPYRYYPSGPFPPGPFPLSGDPVARTGFIDGLGEDWSLAPGDRRLLLNSGPFELAPGDTQEIVVGTVGGLGSDRLSSVSVMKFNDNFVQNTFDALFAVPKPPLAPSVKFAQMDEQIILDWGSDAERTDAIENRVAQPGDYQFEGYNVYQFPSAASTLADAKRIATYDLPTDPAIILDQVFDVATGLILNKPIEFGSNSGIKRQFVFNQDYVKGVGKLYNGSEYFLAVTAYTNSKKEGFSPTALESTPIVYRLVPQSPPPGTRYGAAYQDTVPTSQTVLAGGSASDGKVTPIVVNPTALTGHNYKVTFKTDAGTGATTWDLTDVSTNTVKLTNQTNQTGDDNYTFVDGLMVKVAGPPPGMKDWSIPSGTRRWTWAGVGSGGNWGSEGFGGAIGNAFDQWFSSSTVTYDKLRNVLLKLAATNTDGVVTDPNDPDYSFGYRYLRSASLPPAKPEFAPFIVNPGPGYAFQDYKKSVPLAAYNVETTPPTRLMLGYLENNRSGGLVDGQYWPGDYNVTDNIASNGAREWLFIFNVPYSETPDASLEVDILDNTLPIMWFCTFNRRGNVAYSANDEFLILANHINTPSNIFTFTAPSNVSDVALAKEDVGKVGVFPNPYYAFNPQEINRSQKFVTFTKLPPRATIRIYNLAGQLVRTIEKNDDTQFLRWNLNNNDNYPVASGMYIVHVDMPDIGATKILKVGIIQEQEVPDVF